MKKTIKIIIMIFVSIVILTQNVIYASMADYDDETADKEMQKEHEEWEKRQEGIINKSSNNYLKNLSIGKYEITPNFDKQIINYEVKTEITENKIMVKAEADDEKASISGTGEIELNSGENNITVDVTAENGTVRSYYIKVVKELKEKLRLSNISLVAMSNEKDVNNIELNPSFDSEIFTYNCNVANYIDKINIEAKANDKNADIEIVGNEHLKEGLNEILVTVKKSNTEKIVYKINVNKEKKDEIETKEENNNQNIAIIIIIIFGCLIILLSIIKSRKNKK